MHTSRSTTSTQTDAGRQKTGRKISDLHNRKAEIGLSILEKITTTPEAAA
jgi:hypothetical protein